MEFNICINVCKDVDALTQELPASSQEHRCCPLHSPTESEPKKVDYVKKKVLTCQFSKLLTLKELSKGHGSIRVSGRTQDD